MDIDINIVDEDEVNNDEPMDDISDAESQVKGMTDFGMSMEIQILNRVKQELDKRQRIVHSLHLLKMVSQNTHNLIGVENSETERKRAWLMTQLVQTEKCQDIIRMSPQAFLQLCQKLRSSGRLKDSTRATVEEQVAKFLHIVGHNVKDRTMSLFFHQLGQMVDSHFRNVLHAIISLANELLVQPSSTDVPPQILGNNNFYPYFKDCIGVVDGIHIRVKVPKADAPRFCGRKGYPTQNVFVACNFDMKFTYLLVGWEGSASDTRILKDALTRKGPLKIPEGKFYIGDAGFMPQPGVLTPYRGVRHCLKDFSKQGPQNYKELFNLHHSSLRDVIGKTLGVLKERFPIIAGDNEPFYSFELMRAIVCACCILHNFLMGIDIDEQNIAEVDRELLQKDIDQSLLQQRDEDYKRGANLRENIALEMWNAYEL